VSEVPVTTTRKCACVSDDGYRCFGARNGCVSIDHVERDGGPCVCDCHDYYDEDLVQ
jgi:hypothetical protein